MLTALPPPPPPPAAATVLIDGGYFLFYRWHALRSYYRRRLDGRDLEPAIDAGEVDAEEVNALMERRCAETLRELAKRYAPARGVLVAMDAPRRELWRSAVYPEYKGGRAPLSERARAVLRRGSEAVRRAAAAAADARIGVVEAEQLEADDLIHVGVRALLAAAPAAQVVIVSNDRDYAALLRPNVRLHDMRGRPVAAAAATAAATATAAACDNGGGGDSEAAAERDAEVRLWAKMLQGDKSDNLPNAFRGCGPKRALALARAHWPDRAALHAALDRCATDARARFERNRRLMDNRELPEALMRRARAVVAPHVRKWAAQAAQAAQQEPPPPQEARSHPPSPLLCRHPLDVELPEAGGAQGLR